MNRKLTLFMLTFPAVMWAAEGFVRWLLNDPEGTSFLYPTIASAAVCFIAPIALPQNRPNYWRSYSLEAIQYAAVCGLVVSLLGWMFCIALGIRKQVPPSLAEMGSYEEWQRISAYALYAYASIVYAWYDARK